MALTPPPPPPAMLMAGGAPQPVPGVPAPAMPATPPAAPPVQPATLPADPLALKPLPAGFDLHQIAPMIQGLVRFKGATPTDTNAVWQELLNQMYVKLGPSAPEGFNWNALLAQWLLDLKNTGRVYEMDEATRNAAGPASTPPVLPHPATDAAGPQLPQPAPAQAKPAGDLGTPAATPNTGAGVQVPSDPAKAVSYNRLTGEQCASLRGLKRSLTMTSKIDWPTYCQRFNLVPETGLEASAVAKPPPVEADDAATKPPPAPPAGPGAPALSAPPAPQNLPPPALAYPGAGVAAAQAPAQAQFVAGASPSPYQAPAQAQFVTGGLPPGTVVNAANVTPAPAAQSRAANAKMLGGEVTLMLVRMQDLASINLTGWADAAQLALLAKAQACASEAVQYLADVKGFKRGDQIMEQAFSQSLTATPKVFVVRRGFDWILPDALLPILWARTTKILLVAEGGTQVQEINP